ncbi:DUF6681 family protein [Lentilactobacillus sp. Marseille-Q4993]|uniref:DUF6681 family protein n=1 Tax=Lentilactobacillus sp. Marseille-Q4993 TaxID=3039492 RepID=UPI0024BC5C7B|nr:DUF6681 family protein [Lentilactobacillus sp. Marseille-Q4993]
MFSFLDMVNHYMGYFNINLTLKSRIYTILGLLGDGYLFYIAFRFLQNGYLSKGILFMAVAIVLLYFALCNLFYYFTNKQAKFDVSPFIAKKLHIAEKPKEVHATSGLGSAVITENPSNGIFDDRHVLPAKVEISAEQQQNIDGLTATLIRHQIVTDNYAGYSDARLQSLLKATGKPVFKIGKGAMAPFFGMKDINHELVVYAGINQAESCPVGTIKRIGLQSIKSVDREELKFFLASVAVVGGPYKEFGRSQMIEHNQPYTVAVKVAYKKRR